MYLECMHNLESKNVIIAFSSHISYCKLKVVKKVEMVSHLIIAYISVRVNGLHFDFALHPV